MGPKAAPITAPGWKYPADRRRVRRAGVQRRGRTGAGRGKRVGGDAMKKFLLALGLAAFSSTAEAAEQPHIIVIIVDDLGWADVGYHGSSTIPTPAIDALVATGVELRQFYAFPDGFQTRAAILTGRWPLRYGLQGIVGKSRDEAGLPVAEKTLAEELQELGYGTYLLGNWGLGSDESTARRIAASITITDRMATRSISTATAIRARSSTGTAMVR